jgi:uncharacterized damage-inducible protein DinB
MNEEFLVRFLTYNDHANRQFIDTIAAAQPKSERIASVFSHILNAHRIWNTRIGGTSPSGGVWDVHAIVQWQPINQSNFARSLELLQAQSLDRVVDYADTKGNRHKNTVAVILFHVVNHSTYHRGQVAILLGHEKQQPPVTDFIAYAREAVK